MEKKHSLKLIEGQFEPSQARSLLFDLIGYKIRYHNSEAFSIKERYNGDISYSLKRVSELKESLAKLEDILSYTVEKGLKLKVDSFIEISFVK